MNAENRRAERFSLNLPARILVRKESAETNVQDENLESHTLDVSASGALFKMERPLNVGAEVEIELVLSLEKLNPHFPFKKKLSRL
ncbi:MAG: PilZ domain-containing protein [Nitrospinales bacterium]